MTPETSLLKVLTGADIGSRRRVTDLIKAGSVTVNGRVAESFSHPVMPGVDRIRVDGVTILLKAIRELPVYLMLNKPPGILSTTHDDRGRKTVIKLLPPEYRHVRLFPIGRLDRDSTGLILLTNDGDITYKLTHPKFLHEKEYRVLINGQLTDDNLANLRSGIHLEDGKTSPARIEPSAQPIPGEYIIIINEGKKRQIRRMFAHLGFRVLGLNRERMGSIRLGSLKPGQVRPLTPEEIYRLNIQA
ncbi:pseudouridine synthase [Chloroflexota bacterium]